MSLKNLTHTTLRGLHADNALILEGLADGIAQERIATKLSSKDKTSFTQQLRWVLCLGWIRVYESFSINQRVELLVIDEMKALVGQKILCNLIWMNAKSLP